MRLVTELHVRGSQITPPRGYWKLWALSCLKRKIIQINFCNHLLSRYQKIKLLFPYVAKGLSTACSTSIYFFRKLWRFHLLSYFQIFIQFSAWSRVFAVLQYQHKVIDQITNSEELVVSAQITLIFFIKFFFYQNICVLNLNLCNHQVYVNTATTEDKYEKT